MPQKAKPSKLKQLQGTYRRDRAKNPPLKADFSIPKCPEWLPAGAKSEWKYLVSELKSKRSLAKVDRGTLALLCTLYDQISQTAAKGEPLSPGIVGQYIKLATAFGFTPAARGGIMPEPEQPEPDPNSWEAFRNRKR